MPENQDFPGVQLSHLRNKSRKHFMHIATALQGFNAVRILCVCVCRLVRLSVCVCVYP